MLMGTDGQFGQVSFATGFYSCGGKQIVLTGRDTAGQTRAVKYLQLLSSQRQLYGDTRRSVRSSIKFLIIKP